MSTDALDRPLSAGERALYDLDAAAPMAFTTVARVRGPLPEATLRAALHAAQARHPLLGARIVEVAGRPHFRAGGAAAALRHVASGDWIAEAERELDERLPTATGPLLRCVHLAHAPDDHTLLLTQHHSVSDGMSGVYLVRDLLRAAAGQPAPPSEGGVPAEQRLPAPARGLQGGLGTLRFLLREGLRTARWGRPVKIPRDAHAPAHARRARVIARTLEPAAAARLATRARAEGSTVHGALSAAILRAVLRDARATGPVRVSFGSPVNLRALLSPAVGEEVGFFVSMLAFGARASAGDDLWALARALGEQAARDRARGLPLDTLGVLGGFVQLLGAGADAATLARRMERALPATTGLSNLGRLEVEDRYGPLSLEALHFLANPTAVGDWTSTATSLRGVLHWNFIWPEPLFSRAHAEALVEDTVAGLLQAV